jgi:hypothetical protein
MIGRRDSPSRLVAIAESHARTPLAWSSLPRVAIDFAALLLAQGVELAVDAKSLVTL